MAQSTRPVPNAGGSSSAQGMHRSTRQFFFYFILRLMRSYRLGIQNALLITSIYETTLIRRFVLMRWRNGTGMFVFADSFGNLNLLNVSRSTLCIRRKVGGYCFCKRVPFHPSGIWNTWPPLKFILPTRLYTKSQYIHHNKWWRNHTPP